MAAPFAANPALLEHLQGRLASLVGRPSGYIDSLPPTVQRRIHALRNLQTDQYALDAQFRDDVLALEKKYLLLQTPLYIKRAAIVSGDHEPTDAEAVPLPYSDEDSEAEAEDEVEATVPALAPAPAQDTASITGIPEFWLTALKNHPQIAELIFDADEPALAALRDIKVAHLDDNPGFSLEFVFAQNDFFSNASLVKTYFLSNSPDSAYADLMYDRADGCDIKWKPSKDLSLKVETKKQRHKATNKVRTLTKTVPCESFFNFFKPPAQPTEGEDMEEEELQELESRLEYDYEVGEVIKEKIIPRAIDWFTGKALDYEPGQDDEDEYGDEDDYDDEDDDEDDGDEDDGDEDEQGNPIPGAAGVRCTSHASPPPFSRA